MNQQPFNSGDILIQNAWYVAGLSEEFKVEELRQLIVAEKAVVIWRTREGVVVAFDDRCCHKRMPLSAGRFIEDGVLECPYHGLCFDGTGRCVRIPSQPELPIPGRAKLRPFPVIEQDGAVWIWPGDPAASASVRPPRTPELVSPGWECISGTIKVRSNLVLMIENLLDLTHFYPLHSKSIGKQQDSRVPISDIEQGEITGCKFVKSIRRVENYPQTQDFADLLTYEVADSYNAQMMVGPGIVFAERSLWPPGRRNEDSVRKRLMNYHCFLPIDRSTHLYRWIVNMPVGQMSGSNPSLPAIQRAKEILAPVFAEDVWALEKQQQAFAFPDDSFEEMFLKSDLALSKARAILSEMQGLEQSGARAPTQAAVMKAAA